MAQSSGCAAFFLAIRSYGRYNVEEVMVVSFDFVQNRECEYFPCHTGADPEKFSCLFCYCPLYALGENCGGNYSYTVGGIKDCSHCLRPHRRECYDDICEKLKLVIEMVKKQP